jgi:hypothetical protein
MAETKKVKEFGPYPGRGTRELISEYRTLKHIVEGYASRGEQLPLAIQVQLPKLNALRASLARMNIQV